MIIAFGVLLVFFNRLFRNVDGFQEDLSQISEGQLSVRVKDYGSLKELARSVNSIVKNTKHLAIDSASQFLKGQEIANKDFEYIGLLNSEGIMKSASQPISKDNFFFPSLF